MDNKWQFITPKFKSNWENSTRITKKKNEDEIHDSKLPMKNKWNETNPNNSIQQDQAIASNPY